MLHEEGHLVGVEEKMGLGGREDSPSFLRKLLEITDPHTGTSMA